MITQTTATLNHDQLDALLASAFEGGSTYWAKKVRVIEDSDEADYTHEIALKGGSVEITDIDGDKYVLNTKALHKGAEAFVAEVPNQYAAIMNGQDDAITGDTFLQCCLYGKVVWG